MYHIGVSSHLIYSDNFAGIVKRPFGPNPVLDFQKKCWSQLAPKFSVLVTRTSILVAKSYIQELMEYNKLNIFYLALTEKERFRLPLNFLSNSFRLRLDY